MLEKRDKVASSIRGDLTLHQGFDLAFRNS